MLIIMLIIMFITNAYPSLMFPDLGSTYICKYLSSDGYLGIFGLSVRPIR